MKQFLILFSLFTIPFSFGQVFHFDTTSTTLVKNTSQSPIHWYLQIYNDAAVDTTLMWKASFHHIPQEWEVLFDAQTQNWPIVHDGDSSLFLLQTTPDLPQKLIIGVMLNDAPGSGTVNFDIFDPNYTTYHETISYNFIVSALGLNQLENIPFGEFSENKFMVNNGKLTSVECFSLDGKLLYTEQGTIEFSLDPILNRSEPTLFHIVQGNEHYVFKMLKN